jgi:hypothetical protein
MGDEQNKKKRVPISTKRLKDHLVKRNEVEIDVPELNALMGLEDDEIATLKVRQLTLNEYLLCQQNIEDKMRNLVEGVIAAAEKRGEVQDEILASYKGLSPMAKYYVDVCSQGVVEPKMTKQDWIFLTKNFPMTVERIATRIIMLTQGGSGLKKNSSD